MKEEQIDGNMQHCFVVHEKCGNLLDRIKYKPSIKQRLFGYPDFMYCWKCGEGFLIDLFLLRRIFNR